MPRLFPMRASWSGAARENLERELNSLTGRRSIFLTVMNVSDIPYELTFDKRPDYLYAVIKADSIDRETALRYLQELADKCSEVNADRVMLERRIPSMMSDADNYLIIQDIIRLIGPRRLAILNPYDSDGEAMAFGNLVGANRGLPYRIFDSADDAEAWLLG